MSDQHDRAESAEPTDAADPIDKMDPIEPMLPIDSTEPTLPTQRIDPFEPMDSNEFSDPSDQREVLTAAGMATSWRSRRCAGKDFMTVQGIIEAEGPPTSRNRRKRRGAGVRAAAAVAAILMVAGPGVVGVASATIPPPTPAPTQISLGGPATVLVNIPFTVGGRGLYFHNGAWVGLNDQLITIQTGRTAAGPWVWLAYLHTTSTGTYALRVSTPGSIFYRAVADPTPSIALSVSKPLLVTAVVPDSVKVLGLPPGPVPIGVPYGIGKRLYLNGATYDFTRSWSSLLGFAAGPSWEQEFAQVTITRGTIVWSILQSCADACEAVGRFRPGGSAVRFAQGLHSGLATTSGGLVAMGVAQIAEPGRVQPLTTSGLSFGPGYAVNGYCVQAALEGAGGSFIIQDQSTNSCGPIPASPSYRLYPGYPAGRLPYNDTYGAGQGPGWLATQDSPTSTCYRTAALASPTVLRARICSQTVPLVSDDGTKAVVVQGNHIRLYDTRTGQQINATNAPTLIPQAGSFYAPFAWESSSAYLVYATAGSTLVVLRCQLNRTCQRAVTTVSRTPSGMPGR